MIATKYLHLLVLGLVVGGWVAPARLEADIALNGSQAASDPSSSEPSGDTAAANGSEDAPVAHSSSSHRRKHKSSTTAADEDKSTSGTATSKGTASKSASAQGKALPKTFTESAPSAPASADSDATGTPAVTKPTRKKRHSKSSVAATASPTASGKAQAKTPPSSLSSAPSKPVVPSASGTNAVPATSVSAASGSAGAPKTAVAKTAVAKTSRRKRHSKENVPASEATVSTNPPPSALVPSKPLALPATNTSAHGTIVITPASVPLVNQAPAVGVAPIVRPPVQSTPIVSFGPTVQTGLPVARPGTGTTATLPTGLGSSIHPGRDLSALPGTASIYPPSETAKFPFTDSPIPPPKRHTQTYPWKTGIITTVFWIGEGGSALSPTTNHASAWNMDWIHDNSGSDDQDDMSGYASSLHASTLNPFYIALPFNDLVYPDKARRWIPASWFKPPRGGKQVSACQDRWIEIKNRAGRTCFAQWEDVGPLRYDHAEYVFGPERPDTLTRAGLDVSPAVALYLGIDRHGSAITSWRFVDDDDVVPGLWLKYDEQAILLRAIKDQSRRSTPIQDLSEPTQDNSSQDANEQKAGRRRG
jgi:hypothetical protein